MNKTIEKTKQCTFIWAYVVHISLHSKGCLEHILKEPYRILSDSMGSDWIL